MKKHLFLAALVAAAAFLPLSCRKAEVPSPGIWGQTKSAAVAADGGTVITFNIRDSYPVYWAQSSSPVPCDVLVHDRHGHTYAIRRGLSTSERQWDIVEEGHAPDRRECDVAVITVPETGEKFSATVGGIRYLFRIGSYDN